MKKIAELQVTDADKFPLESIREKLARRYGLDAVALSGPCEGQPIVECVCDQLNKRWDRIKDRFASTNRTDKTLRLAHKMAESFMQKDDTMDAINDIKKMGFGAKASSEIASYLKAFAMDDVADDEFNKATDDVESPDATDPKAEDSSDDFGGDDDSSNSPFSDDSEPDFGGETPSTDDGIGGEDTGLDVGGDDDDVVDVGLDGDDDLGADLDNPIVDDAAGGLDDVGEMVTIEIPKDVAQEIAHSIIDGVHGGDDAGVQDLDIGLDGGEGPENLEVEIFDGGDIGGEGDDFGGEDAVVDVEVPGEPIDEQGDEGEQVVTNDAPEGLDDAAPSEPAGSDIHGGENDLGREAALKMRAGRILKAGESVLKLGPEMSINNTDQQAGHDKKQLGTAKEKSVGEPKGLDESVKTEGYSAGGNKFQDGKTLKNEQKFDPKKVDKGSLSGGDKSKMGKNESYPDKKPEVPAGSSAIGGESGTGGNLDTLGVGGVVATITPDGIFVEANGRKYRGKAKLAGLSSASISKIVDEIGKIAFDGDGKKFTVAALKVVAEECKDCKTYDGGKKEAEDFTNDGEKKADDSKGKGGKATKPAEEQPTCDNGKKEVSNFTNDGDKKPEGSKAASSKNKRTAGDKKIEEPKALDEQVETEGFTAGGDKFQDGKTLKNEQKFDPKKVNESEFTGGDSSLMGKDESYAKDGPSVPAGGPPLSHDEHTGGNVSTTKGQGAIASQSQKSQVLAETQAKLNDANVKEVRLKAASVYLADLMRHGEISDAEYPKELEKVASLPVQAIQALIVSTKKARERVVSAAAKQQGSKQTESLTVPILISASTNEPMSLKDRLVREMKITRDLDAFDALPDRRR